jgi:Undecaprenyl-phosphate galactose phosphotransferase WbaP
MGSTAAVSPKTATQQLPKADWTPLSMAIVRASIDLCSLSIAVFLGFRIWSLVNPEIPPLHPAMLLMPVLSVASLLFFGLYPGIGLNAVTQMKRASEGLTLVFLLFTAVMFMTKNRWADSRGGFVLAWVLSMVITPIGRLLMSKLLISQSNWGVPVVIIGAGSAARSVIMSLKEHQVLGYRPLACVSEELDYEAYCEGVPVVGCLEELPTVAKSLGAQHAIVAIPSMPPDRLTAHMRTWGKVFPRILIVPNLEGIASLWTEPRDLGGVLAVEVQHKLLDRWNQLVKRASDIVVASFAILVSAPIVACAALLIRLKSPGKVFYVQEREGKNGEKIHILKLRTMHPEAETMLAKYLATDEDADREWRRFYKLRKDPRIVSGIGQFARITSIDELPQLWNVLKGEMSLVGPRPFPAYHNAQFSPDFRDLRLHVMPGLTGLWQVAARSNGDLKVQEAMDAYYIRNWSLWLDVYILLRTARAVILPFGSY